MIVAEKSRDILNKNKLAIEASKKWLEGRKRNVQKQIWDVLARKLPQIVSAFRNLSL